MDEIELIRYLKEMTLKISFSFGICIFIFGILGNVLNVFILSKRSVRSNTCVIIFISSSVTGILAVLSGLTARILSNWGLDLSSTIPWICKARGFVLFVSRSVTFWLLMLATIDRWLVSSSRVPRRQLSSKKNVYRSICILIFISLILHSQILYCYEANLQNTPLKCYYPNRFCRLYNDLIFSIAIILVPLILMITFGLMTISNIRSTQNRVEPTSVRTIPTHSRDLHEYRRRRLKKLDRHLCSMLLIQVIIFAVSTFPLMIQRFYATFTIDLTRSALRSVIEDFIYQISLILFYLPMGMSFYLNILSGGSLFRKQMRTFQQLLSQKLMCR